MDSPYWIIDDAIIFKPEFNECLDNYLDIISNYRILYFSNYDDPHLVLKYKNIYNKKLDTSSSFDKPLSNSLSGLQNLEELDFGYSFNKSLGNSLSKLTNLRKLTLGYNFNQHIVIPGGIKKLSLNSNSQSIIDYLPSSIEELVFGWTFNLELDDLPSSIKKIKIRNASYNKKLNNLPSSLETLKLSSKYKVSIDREYKNLLIVYLD